MWFSTAKRTDKCMYTDTSLYWTLHETLNNVFNTYKCKDDLFSSFSPVNHIKYAIYQMTGEMAKLSSILLKRGLYSYYKVAHLSGPI